MATVLLLTELSDLLLLQRSTRSFFNFSNYRKPRKRRSGNRSGRKQWQNGFQGRRETLRRTFHPRLEGTVNDNEMWRDALVIHIYIQTLLASSTDLILPWGPLH